MKTKVIDYNKEKAKKKFVLFKLAELFGLFLFLFGFNTLGHLSYRILTDSFWGEVNTSLGYWATGFATLLLLAIAGLGIFCICKLIYIIIKSWLKINWEWAKIASENPKSKIERLKEKEKLREIKNIEVDESDRKKFGVCEGDIVTLKKNLVVDREYGGSTFWSSKKFTGSKKIDKVFSNSDIRVDGKDYYTKEMFSKIIKKKIPKKPKLNIKYIKEQK